MAELSQIRRGRRTIFGWRPSNSTGILVAGTLGAAACLTAVALFQVTLGTPATDPPLTDLASPIDGIEAGGLDRGSVEVATGLAPSTTQPSSSAPSTEAAPLPVLQIVSPAAAAVAEDQLVGITIGSELVASGLLVDGYLITSASAVGNQLSVSFSHQDRSSLAYLVGIDVFSDLAVFRPSAESRAGRTLEALSTNLTDVGGSDDEIATTNPAQSGDNVMTATLTNDGIHSSIGIVLATDRAGMTSVGQPLIGLIDTSVRRPEHLGSVLMDADGGVIGIVVNTSSALASAIPIRDAVAIADRLTAQGWANETWIGFIGINRERGVEVIDVTVDGPAEDADLRPGDVIRFFDGAPIEHMGGITAGLRRAAPGDTIILVIDRSGDWLALRVEASAYQADVADSAEDDPNSADPQRSDPQRSDPQRSDPQRSDTERTDTERTDTGRAIGPKLVSEPVGG